MHAATTTAFASTRRGPASSISSPAVVRLRIHPAAITFVSGFPGGIGLVGVLAALSRGRAFDDGGIFVGYLPLVVGAVLLVLGLRSFLRVGPDDVTVRFYGLRRTTVRFRELRSGTFGMAVPSISFAITLTDRNGRKALVHANWWRGEDAAIRPVLRALLEHSVPMDRTIARLVSQVLKVKRPRVQIVHHGLFRKDRTW
jgi:hypothetical protein